MPWFRAWNSFLFVNLFRVWEAWWNIIFGFSEHKQIKTQFHLDTYSFQLEIGMFVRPVGNCQSPSDRRLWSWHRARRWLSCSYWFWPQTSLWELSVCRMCPGHRSQARDTKCIWESPVTRSPPDTQIKLVKRILEQCDIHIEGPCPILGPLRGGGVNLEPGL